MSKCFMVVTILFGKAHEQYQHVTHLLTKNINNLIVCP